MYEGDLKQKIRQQWGNRARTYDNCPGHGIHSEQEKQTWMQILSNALEQKQGLRVLDVGTGTGALALLLAELGHETVGIDLSKRMLKKAGEKAQSGNLFVEFKVGDAEDPPFGHGSFDAIVSRHVLWTLPDPENAGKAWKDLLKPGGIIVIIDGDFTRNKRTILQEIWRLMAIPLILLTEKRDPRMKKQDWDEQLPMRRWKRPAADIKLFESLGFAASVTEVELPREYSILNYIKYGYSRYSKYQFVVKGVKTA
ncbi:MAG: class I SAM-dependent methyltransferase [Deltaproteobacteria bacterium]|nr:class I SAM-dependent methyltransferase [Deltaproteobacteria bacterium]